MIQWVFEAAARTGISDQIVVATPDAEIQEACAHFGAEVVMTRDDHLSGTDRLAEVAESIQADIYVNVQGDEPMMLESDIAACAKPLMRDFALRMSSLYAHCPDEEVDNPAVVKVVMDRAGDALYFSRHAIPFARNPRIVEVCKHIGLYAYRRDVLMAFATWEPTPLERTESLEQLRFLENGVRIRMSPGSGAGLAVDTPAQADEVRAILERST